MLNIITITLIGMISFSVFASVNWEPSRVDFYMQDLRNESWRLDNEVTREVSSDRGHNGQRRRALDETRWFRNDVVKLGQLFTSFPQDPSRSYQQFIYTKNRFLDLSWSIRLGDFSYWVNNSSDQIRRIIDQLDYLYNFAQTKSLNPFINYRGNFNGEPGLLSLKVKSHNSRSKTYQLIVSLKLDSSDDLYTSEEEIKEEDLITMIQARYYVSICDDLEGQLEFIVVKGKKFKTCKVKFEEDSSLKKWPFLKAINSAYMQTLKKAFGPSDEKITWYWFGEFPINGVGKIYTEGEMDVLVENYRW